MRRRTTSFTVMAAVVLVAAAVPTTSAAMSAATPGSAASPAAVTAGVYTLTNVYSGKLMDVQYASTAAGAPVLQYHLNEGANQQWNVAQTASGSYTLESANSGLCLDTPDPSNAAPPVQLVQNTCDGSTHQKWNIQVVDDGSYNLVNVATGLLADDANGSQTDGNAIIQWWPNGGTNQRWKLAPLTRVGAFSAGLHGNGQAGGQTFDNQTLRMVVPASVAGGLPRVRLSNLYGSAPLTVGAVDLAKQSSTPGVAVAGTHHSVTFGASAGVIIPAGQDVFSDPVPMGVGADQDLLVSVYLPNRPTGADSWHYQATDTTWVSRAATPNDDYAADDGTGNYPTTIGSWFVLAGLDLTSSTATGTVVAVGDSITDGYGSGSGLNHRWPDDLARHLNQNPNGTSRGVVDAGISANAVTMDVSWPGGANYSLVKRFGHDVLSQTGVKDVILLEGINDIQSFADDSSTWTPAQAAAAEAADDQQLEGGIATVTSQARKAGLTVTGCTITPWQGWGTYTPFREKIREDVNDWIRASVGTQSTQFNAVVDLDKTVQDPTNPLAINHQPGTNYDSGDHLHPNDTGYQAMADAVAGTVVFP